jgi:phage terminase small subunit
MSSAAAYREAYNVGKNTKDETVWVNACQLKSDTKVLRRIEELRQQKLEAVLLDTSQILQMYNAIATANIEDAYDEEGNFHIERLPKGCIKQVRRNKEGKIIGAELYDKQKSLDKIADLYGVGDKIQTTSSGIDIKFRDDIEDYSE